MPRSIPGFPAPRAAHPVARRNVVAALVAIGAALSIAWLVDGGAVRSIGAAAIVLAAIGLSTWQARRVFRATARDAVDRAQRELLTGMGHDLRTPLNSVIGFSSVLIRNCAGRLTTQELDYLERVRTNGLQLLRVVDEALARGAARAALDPASSGESVSPR